MFKPVCYVSLRGDIPYVSTVMGRCGEGDEKGAKRSKGIIPRPIITAPPCSGRDRERLLLSLNSQESDLGNLTVIARVDYNG